jgi:hypothetical protein
MTDSKASKYCWLASFLTIPVSVGLYFTHSHDAGIFVGLWVAPLMILAATNDWIGHRVLANGQFLPFVTHRRISKFSLLLRKFLQ